MSEHIYMTSFQLGTWAHHALRDSSAAGRLGLSVLELIHVREDPSEAWLADYPPQKVISREDADAALALLRLSSQRRLQKQLSAAHDVYVKGVLAVNEQFELGLAKLREEYSNRLTTILGHQPNTDDMQAAERAYLEQVRASHAIAAEPPCTKSIEDDPRERAYINGLAAIAYTKRAMYGERAESMPEELFKTPEWVRRAGSPEAAKEAARIAAQYEMYRQVIAEIERRNSRKR